MGTSTREAPAAPVTISILVTGMTCAACQARVQRTLQKQPAVEDAGVNLMLETATVRFRPEAVSPEQLVEAIHRVGYGAELAPASASVLEAQEELDRAQAGEASTLRIKAIIGAVIGALMMV